jgi:rhamnulokinase
MPHITDRIGLEHACAVTAVGSHDTASAIAAIPSTEPGFGYMSCRTWSLAGVETDEPIITEPSRHANFTNEAGIDNR